MSYPIDDNGFTLWHGDLDTQLKRFHGITSKEMGVEHRLLLDRYYAGDSVHAALEKIVRQHAAKI